MLRKGETLKKIRGEEVLWFFMLPRLFESYSYSSWESVDGGELTFYEFNIVQY